MGLWDVATRKRLAEDSLALKLGGVKSVAFSPDGKTLATGYQSRTWISDDAFGAVIDQGSSVDLWGVATSEPMVLSESPFRFKLFEGEVTSLVFSPDGKTLATGFAGRGRRRRGTSKQGRHRYEPSTT